MAHPLSHITPCFQLHTLSTAGSGGQGADGPGRRACVPVLRAGGVVPLMAVQADVLCYAVLCCAVRPGRLGVLCIAGGSVSLLQCDACSWRGGRRRASCGHIHTPPPCRHHHNALPPTLSCQASILRDMRDRNVIQFVGICMGKEEEGQPDEVRTGGRARVVWWWQRVAPPPSIPTLPTPPCLSPIASVQAMMIQEFAEAGMPLGSGSSRCGSSVLGREEVPRGDGFAASSSCSIWGGKGRVSSHLMPPHPPPPCR